MKHLVQRGLDLAERSPVRAMWWITTLMVLVTAARYAQSPPRPTDDQTSNWWPVVNSLLDGQGFVSCLPEYFPFCEEDSPTAMREPVPLLVHAGMAFLSGRSLWAASLLQAALNILAVWLLFSLARRLSGVRTAIITAAIWAIYLPAYWDIINIAGDQMAVVLLLCGALLLERAIRADRRADLLFAGLLFGLAALCRSATIAFAVLAGAMVLFLGPLRMMPKRLLSAALFTMGVCMALGPWAMRNQQVFHHAFLGSTLSGYNLFRHNSSIKGEHYCHFVAAEEGQGYLDSLIAAHPELTHHENEAEMNALYASAGKATIAAHICRYITLSAYRMVPLWTNWGVNAAYGKPFGAIDAVIAMLQLVLLGLAVAGFLQGAPWRWPLALGIGLYCAMHMLVVCRLRFLLPAMPWVACFAALPLERLLSKGRA